MRTMINRVALLLVAGMAAAGCDGADATAPDAAALAGFDDPAAYAGPVTLDEYWRAEAAALAAMPAGGFRMRADSTCDCLVRPDSMYRRGGGAGHRRGPGSLVIHTLHRSLREYAVTGGDSAARALALPVHELLDSARTAFLAGDSAGAAALVERAYLAAATIVVDLDGSAPLDRLTQRVDSGLARLDAAIARGADDDIDVARLIELRDFVAALHADAAALRAAGDLPRALVAEAIAAQSLGRALHRVRGEGRAPGDGPGMHDGPRDGRGRGGRGGYGMYR